MEPNGEALEIPAEDFPHDSSWERELLGVPSVLVWVIQPIHFISQSFRPFLKWQQWWQQWCLQEVRRHGCGGRESREEVVKKLWWLGRNICQAKGKYFDKLIPSFILVHLIWFFWDNVRPSKYRKNRKGKEVNSLTPAENFSFSSPGGQMVADIAIQLSGLHPKLGPS